ncbi:hypothetical protein JKP88DRAFT_300818 [Tribonema minus]|uniref:C2 domain-containing protein n=1 Tax=Tribonema minus TaxID=303371 RepID=A0A836CKJ1_9STRA|nr:hypothetical protein JKP88DRAFT_300818 [Tribonema minus]
MIARKKADDGKGAANTFVTARNAVVKLIPYKKLLGDADERGSSSSKPLDFRHDSSRLALLTPFLHQEVHADMSVGELTVDVVEARGLRAADFNGRSDPYAVLVMTGRYLSHAQEWPPEARVTRRTAVKMFTLHPEWNETFAFPVRRAGARLQVLLYDKDLTSADDLLGCLEITLDEELLSGATIDRWYPLQPALPPPPCPAVPLPHAAVRRARHGGKLPNCAAAAAAAVAANGATAAGGSFSAGSTPAAAKKRGRSEQQQQQRPGQVIAQPRSTSAQALVPTAAAAAAARRTAGGGGAPGIIGDDRAPSPPPRGSRAAHSVGSQALMMASPPMRRLSEPASPSAAAAAAAAPTRRLPSLGLSKLRKTLAGSSSSSGGGGGGGRVGSKSAHAAYARSGSDTASEASLTSARHGSSFGGAKGGSSAQQHHHPLASPPPPRLQQAATEPLPRTPPLRTPTSSSSAAQQQQRGAHASPLAAALHMPSLLFHHRGSGAAGFAAPLGLVHLQLRLDVARDAYLVSHLWPDAPYQPSLEVFSPNRLARKLQRLWALMAPYVAALRAVDDVQVRRAPLPHMHLATYARMDVGLRVRLMAPYVATLRAVDDVQGCVSPLTTLKWWAILMVLLAAPSLLCVAVHAWLVRMVWGNYRRAEAYKRAQQAHRRRAPTDIGRGQTRIGALNGIAKGASRHANGKAAAAGSGGGGSAPNTPAEPLGKGDGAASAKRASGSFTGSSGSSSSSSAPLSAEVHARAHTPAAAAAAAAFATVRNAAASAYASAHSGGAAADANGSATAAAAVAAAAASDSRRQTAAAALADEHGGGRARAALDLWRDGTSAGDSGGGGSGGSGSSLTTAYASDDDDDIDRAAERCLGSSQMEKAVTGSATDAEEEEEDDAADDAADAGAEADGKGAEKGAEGAGKGEGGEHAAAADGAAEKGKEKAPLCPRKRAAAYREKRAAFSLRGSTADQALLSVEEKLENQRKFSGLVNSLGKVVLNRSGPHIQFQVDKVVLNRSGPHIQFQIVVDLVLAHTVMHPQTRARLALLVGALCAHCALLVAVYRAGALNWYIAAGVTARFLQKFYKRWGRAAAAAARAALAARASMLRAAAARRAAAAPRRTRLRAAMTTVLAATRLRPNGGGGSGGGGGGGGSATAARLLKEQRRRRSAKHRRRLRWDRLAMLIVVVTVARAGVAALLARRGGVGGGGGSRGSGSVLQWDIRWLRAARAAVAEWQSLSQQS